MHPTDAFVNSDSTGLYPLLPPSTTQKFIIPGAKAGKLQDKNAISAQDFCSCLQAFAATF